MDKAQLRQPDSSDNVPQCCMCITALLCRTDSNSRSALVVS